MQQNIWKQTAKEELKDHYSGKRVYSQETKMLPPINYYFYYFLFLL